MRGYDPEAVDQAWTEMDEQLSVVNASNKELRLQLNSLREQNSEWGNRLQHYEQIEKDLRDALLSAQRIANQVKEDATKQSDELLQSARLESESILNEARRISELKEAEAATALIEKQKEINEIQEQIQKLTEQKAVLQNQVDEAIRYLETVKGLLEPIINSPAQDSISTEHDEFLAEEDVKEALF